MLRVYGVSMHLFDQARNSDKFYRTFIWPADGAWHIAFHWGRDGAPHGQVKHEVHGTMEAAQRAMDTKVSKQVSKGYQNLGQGTVEIAEHVLLNDPSAAGMILHDRIGRKPMKPRDGFDLIIMEEDDIMDLIA